MAAPVEIDKWEEAPKSLRHCILEKSVELGLDPHGLRDIACSVLRVRPHPGNWSPYPDVLKETEGLVYECNWFYVYDIAERIFRAMGDRRREEYDDDNGKVRQTAFEEELNDFFVERGFGWQMVSGRVVTRETETFELTIRTTMEALS